MKKKIIFVISGMSVGGAQKSLINALRIFDYAEYDVTLYVREDKTDLLSEIPENVRVIVNRNKAKYDLYPAALFFELLKRLSRLTKNKRLEKLSDKKCTAYVVKKKTAYERKHHQALNEGYDIAVAYLQGYVCKFTADCIHAGRMICFFHNSTDALPQLHKEYLPKYEKIAAVSDESQQLLQKAYPSIRDRFVVIPNLVDDREIKRKAKAFSIDEKSDGIILCTCGRISREKGYDLAVRAAKRLADEGLAFSWYFIGDGPEFGRIQREIADRRLTDKIILLGNRHNPYPWIAACDIYIQPSYEEAQPFSVMEAQILQRPVVSTDTVGGRSLITYRFDGLLTAVNDEALASGIAFLAKHDAERKKYSANLEGNRFEAYNDKIKQQWHNLLT